MTSDASDGRVDSDAEGGDSWYVPQASRSLYRESGQNSTESAEYSVSKYAMDILLNPGATMAPSVS